MRAAHAPVPVLRCRAHFTHAYATHAYRGTYIVRERGRERGREREKETTYTCFAHVTCAELHARTHIYTHIICAEGGGAAIVAARRRPKRCV